jgi:DNA-binding SARP family transcriptional activator
MLSGYECSIFGYDRLILDDHSPGFIELNHHPINNELLSKFTSENLLQNAWSFARAGDIPRANLLAERVLDLESNNLLSAEAHILIGNLATEVNEFPKAESNFFKSASICRSLNHEKGIGVSLQNLAALVYLTQGQVDLALTIMEESNFHMLKASEPVWGYPLLQAYIFDAFGDRPKLIKALDDLILQITPGSYAAGVYFLIWAKICLDDNETQKADEYLRLAFRIANQLDLPDLSVFVRNEKSRYFRMKGQLSVALNWCNDSTNYAKRIKSPYLIGHALIEMGQVFWFSGDNQSAEKHFYHAIKQFKKANSPLDCTRAEFLLAALFQINKNQKADEYFLYATDEIIKNGYSSILFRDRKLIYPLISGYLKKSGGEIHEKAEALLDIVIQAPPTPLRILGLGQYRVWQGQHLLPDQPWSRRKSGVLFRFLLLQPDQSASREVIMDALWPDMDPESATDTLYQATSTLRRIFEPDLPDKFPSRYMVIEGERVSLKLPSGSYTDFDHFEKELPAAIKNRKIEDLQLLLALHEGELFPMDRYSDWVNARRNLVETLYLQGLHNLGMLFLINQDYYQELEISRKILRIDPWNEDAILMGMQAYLGMNNAPRALIYFEDFKKSLENELGIKPRADIRELAAEITNR